MRLLKRFRPSPAMVVACLALLIALGGSSYAAIQALPRNSVTSVQVKDRSLLARDFRAGQIPRGPAGPAGPQGPAGPPGPAGPAGAAGGAKAWAHVRANGTVEPTRSQGITDSDLTHAAGSGTYCIHVQGALGAVATLETEAGHVAVVAPPTSCAAGREIEVRTFGVSGGSSEKAFWVLVL